MVLIRAIATVGGLTMVSRVFGFVRDILVAATLGAGLAADAFFVAFKLPNLFRRLFAEGAFSAAFVPLFARRLEGEGKEAAVSFARQALSVLFWAVLLVVVVVELTMPWIMHVLAPGFADQPEKFELAILLTRITFPYLLFISMVTLFAGVMNAFGRFWHAAATPILLNLCLIGAVLVLAPMMATPGHALAWGVFGAGVVQFGWMAVHMRRAGISLGLMRPRLSDDVKILLKRMAPVAVGAGIYQVNLVIDTVIASLLPQGSISYLFYADRVNQLPLGVVGVAVGTALLPLLSRQLRSGDETAAHHSQNRAMEFALLLTLPAAAALGVLAEPVIVTLFQRGAFGLAEAQATAAALAVYALGLPAYVLVKALSTPFFAREDTVTPVKVAFVAMIVNVVLNLALMGPFLHVGIAMATVVSAWLNAITLAVILMRRGHLVLDTRFLSRLPRTIAAAGLMGAALFYALPHADALLAGAEWQRAAGLAALVGLGLVTFGMLAAITGAARPSDLKSMMRGKA